MREVRRDLKELFVCVQQHNAMRKFVWTVSSAQQQVSSGVHHSCDILLVGLIVARRCGCHHRASQCLLLGGFFHSSGNHTTLGDDRFAKLGDHAAVRRAAQNVPTGRRKLRGVLRKSVHHFVTVVVCRQATANVHVRDAAIRVGGSQARVDLISQLQDVQRALHHQLHRHTLAAHMAHDASEERILQKGQDHLLSQVRDALSQHTVRVLVSVRRWHTKLRSARGSAQRSNSARANHGIHPEANAAGALDSLPGQCLQRGVNFLHLGVGVRVDGDAVAQGKLDLRQSLAGAVEHDFVRCTNSQCLFDLHDRRRLHAQVQTGHVLQQKGQWCCLDRKAMRELHARRKGSGELPLQGMYICGECVEVIENSHIGHRTRAGIDLF
mmetsp:Transcript_54913/g.96060  ORF Transcript_54913/g.96060 Transcript_54913/m.96060 type:complete len:381 (+) Transcript_54913:526-1668(+)